MLKTYMFKGYQFYFLAVFIEFEKLSGNDDQNNVKHSHFVIKKRKCVIWRLQIEYFDMRPRIKMLEWTTGFGIP